MALIEFKRCPQCGKTTWQEFIPQAPPALSYWRCRDCGDRREAVRVSVGNGAQLYRGRVQTEDVCADVLIVDISRRGARLRCHDDLPVRVSMGQRILFNPQLQPFGELAHYQAGFVRWIHGDEFGICFEHSLSLSPSDITRIVKN